MNNTPLISIGIPAFKSWFINEAIESILAQDYPHFELIIINDASPEDIDSIVHSFHDDRIKYFVNKCNMGGENVVDNWNRCLDLAKGDFFVLMGDDDRMERSYLSEFCRLIQKHPHLDVYHCRSLIIDENSNPVRFTASWPEYESLYENIWHRMNFLREQFLSDFMYRTTALKSNGGFFKLPLAWLSDDITSYIAMGNKGIAHTQEPVFCYRENRFSISNSGSIELKLLAAKKGIDWLHRFLNEKICVDNNQSIFYQNILKGLPTYRSKMNKSNILLARKSRNVSLLIKLLFNRRQYVLSFKEYFEGLLGKI